MIEERIWGLKWNIFLSYYLPIQPSVSSISCFHYRNVAQKSVASEVACVARSFFFFWRVLYLWFVK